MIIDILSAGLIQPILPKSLSNDNGDNSENGIKALGLLTK